MNADAEECWQKAADFAVLSRVTTSEHLRNYYLEMARDFRALADAYENPIFVSKKER